MLAATIITLSPVVTSFVIGSALPFVHDLLVSIHASSRLQAAVAVVLSVVGAFLQYVLRSDGSAPISTQSLMAFFIILLTGRSTFKFYQNLGLNDKLAPEFGIGMGNAPK